MVPAMNRLRYQPARALRHLRAADERLAAVIDAAGPFTMRPDPELDVYQALLRSIVYQQLSGKAAATILGRVLELWDGRFPTPHELLAIDEQQLRGAGLSRNKTAAILDLGAKTMEGLVPTLEEAHGLDDEVLVERLTAVRGVGRWTVEMLLMFRLGRPDVLPLADLGVRKGFARTYGLADLPTPAELEAGAACWRPYRSVGSWYMWRAVDLGELPM